MLTVEQKASSRCNIVIDGAPITIPQLRSISINACEMRLTNDGDRLAKLRHAAQLVSQAVANGDSIYGITTGFGGMANVPVPSDLAVASQNNLLSFLATGAGDPIDRRHVRGAMALRANVLVQGRSGIRVELIERLVRFLNADAIPVVRELGSIGASGDLVPLSAIARAITGQSEFVKVQVDDEIVGSKSALRKLGLDPIELQPKEGLAIANGTSFSASIAANCVSEARPLLAIALGAQAMMLRALKVQDEPFEDFVHQCKPHPGQVWTARAMRRLLERDTSARNGVKQKGQAADVQDRYSMRCLPQYMGPIVEGIFRIGKTIETEMNSVSDNPLIDIDGNRFYQSGNFLGQYVGIAMDDLRRFIGLMAKHLDVQIALLVAPEFNRGLPMSLRGNDQRSYNMGLKGLQITGNSIMPMLTYYGNPIVDHFPTHAEQFNQNVNGLSWGSAKPSLEIDRTVSALSLRCVDFLGAALDLRSKATFDHFDGTIRIGSRLRNLFMNRSMPPWTANLEASDRFCLTIPITGSRKNLPCCSITFERRVRSLKRFIHF